VFAFALAAAAPIFAEESAQEKAQKETPLRKEIVKLKYVRAQDIQSILQAYVGRGGHVSFNPSMPSILSVSDTPENVDKILAAVREIDVKPADIQFTVQLVLGAETGEPGKESMTNDPIIRELKNLLKYKTYTLLDASLVRAMDHEDSEVRLGEKTDFELQLRPKVMRDEKTSLIQTMVRLRRIVPAVQSSITAPGSSAPTPVTVTEHGEMLIGTTLNIKSGEKAVVGVSKLDGGGKGLILIISGKIVD
jgi:hypothetical protein